MNADNYIDEIIKDAKDYLIKNRLHVGTAVSVGYKDVRADFYGLESRGTESLKLVLMTLDDELDTVIPLKEDGFNEAKASLMDRYNEVIEKADEYIDEVTPLSAMAQKRYETVDRVLCQLKLELSRLKYTSIDEIKALKKSKLTFDGLFALNSLGKTVKAAGKKAKTKPAPGENAEALNMDSYVKELKEADKAAKTKNKKIKDKLIKDIEEALERDERVILKLKGEDNSLPALTRFKVLGLAEKDGMSFVMVRNPWDEGRITYETAKASGKVTARVRKEDESAALYIKEDLAAVLMEIVK